MNKPAKRLKFLQLNEAFGDEKGVFIKSLVNFPKTMQLVISDFFCRKKDVFDLGFSFCTFGIYSYNPDVNIFDNLRQELGVHRVNFVRNPTFNYIFVPVATLLAAVFATSIGVKGMGKMNISRFLKEE